MADMHRKFASNWSLMASSKLTIMKTSVTQSKTLVQRRRHCRRRRYGRRRRRRGGGHHFKADNHYRLIQKGTFA